jgi:nucleoside-diphosphate-sugar epimerase
VPVGENVKLRLAGIVAVDFIRQKRMTGKIKLVCGAGYLGLRVARRWQALGDEVHVLTRWPDKAARFADLHLVPHIADLGARDGLTKWPTLPHYDTVLFAVGWDRRPGQQQREVYVEGLAQLLSVLRSVGRFVYISSTGVYGAGSGDWVDEATPCHPLREGGECCLAAEELLAQHRLSQKRVVLRLAGIYGPQRIPRAADLQAGLPIDAPGQGFLNLIHVDDAAHIVQLAESRAPDAATYVVSDGEPVLRSHYYAELARLLQAPPPRFVDPAPHSPAQRRAASDKRVRPTKMFQELAPTLQFPSYREGLADAVAKLPSGMK